MYPPGDTRNGTDSEHGRREAASKRVPAPPAAGPRSPPIRWHGIWIGRIPLATPAEETTLARDIEVGLLAAYKLSTPAVHDDGLRADLRVLAGRGQLAQKRLIEANPRLVTAIANRYLGWGMGLADLVQEGNLGLIHAVEKFDYRTGTRFSAYAGWWIRQGITTALAEREPAIRVPYRQNAR